MYVRYIISVNGTVQGVGFRPFVYRIAGINDLKGQVINTPDGVQIDVEGEKSSVEKFIKSLKEDSPSLAKIEDISIKPQAIVGYTEFAIGQTKRSGSAEAIVSVDVSVCPDCLRELLDPEDRRYRYPFINCTNCGPRFTIIKEVPYDREYTTMKMFPMCDECSTEYHDPANRRFHAQPNACFKCGPRVELRDNSGGIIELEEPVAKTAELLKTGFIVAIKGLGGYHLACNALDNEPVNNLRQRKVREDKPFAVMVKDLEQARKYCHIDNQEAGLLSAPARPIVLLRKKDNGLAEQVAPGNAFLGLMLPYTPVHYLLFELVEFPLVMTSANLGDEPIAYKDDDAFLRLGHIAEYFLTHNREINHRCDDSVLRVYRGREYSMRRARGYAPAPFKLSTEMTQILAVGGEQKNTFCLTKGRYAFVSHHIGDLENLETLEAFEREILMYKKLFNVQPEIVAYDYHPEYLSTKYALDLPGIEKKGVQHHHAHIASCMAENGLEGKVLGVAFDGTGFGPDGSIWGGEFLYASLDEYKRFGHLKYIPMPGGGKAVKEPWRMAAGYLHSQFGEKWRDQNVVFLKEKNGMLLNALGEMMDKCINCLPTSSMGRFFDATSALMGIRNLVNYEGQAAVELEQYAVAYNGRQEAGLEYEFLIKKGQRSWEVNTDPIVRGILNDIDHGKNKDLMAYKFHVTIKNIVTSICLMAREELGENRVCLSGGVFQNMLLLDLVHRALEQKGFDVYVHKLLPPNDGSISLGQAVIANARRKTGCV